MTTVNKAKGIATPQSSAEEGNDGPMETRQLHMTFQLSKDGVPGMSCSRKAPWLKDRCYGLEEYLSVGKMAGIHNRYRESSFWLDYAHRAGENSDAWRRVHDAMATFRCTMEAVSKPGCGWVYFPPVNGGGTAESGAAEGVKKAEGA